MGDNVGFEGYLDKSADFDVHEHTAVWKRPAYAPWGLETYPDFSISNTYNQSCELPRFWYEDGSRVPLSDIGIERGCMASDFDQVRRFFFLLAELTRAAVRHHRGLRRLSRLAPSDHFFRLGPGSAQRMASAGWRSPQGPRLLGHRGPRL